MTQIMMLLHCLSGTYEISGRWIFVRLSVQTKQIRIKYTQMKQYKERVNTSTLITKTPTHYKTHTYTRPHITKQIKATTVHDRHQMK